MFYSHWSNMCLHKQAARFSAIVVHSFLYGKISAEFKSITVLPKEKFFYSSVLSLSIF